MNCPKDPEAMIIPRKRDLFFEFIDLPVTDSAIPKTPEEPIPINILEPNKSNSELIFPTQIQLIICNNPKINIVLPAPYLSENPPNIGAPIPENKIPKAPARLNNSLPEFSSVVIGSKNNPFEWLSPNVMNTVTPPPKTTYNGDFFNNFILDCANKWNYIC